MRKFTVVFTIFSCLLLLVPFSVNAEESSFASKIQSSLFLLGVPDESLRREPYFIPLDRIPWLWAITQSEPLLKSVIVHIDEWRPNFLDMWTEEYADSQYIPTSKLPDGYVFTDVRAWSSMGETPKDYFFLPSRQGDAFSARCVRSNVFPDQLSICFLNVKYEENSSVFLRARIYDPDQYSDLGSAFYALTERISSIVTCLDVTDDPPNSYDLEEVKYCVKNGEVTFGESKN